MTANITWHHEVGLQPPPGLYTAMKEEAEIAGRVQQQLDKVESTEKVELLGHLFDLYAPPHNYWTRREQFGEGTGEFNDQQREYFQEREKIFGKNGRVPILGSLVLRTYELDRLYDMRLKGRGETTFRVWTDWSERISIESRAPEQFTHVNQEVIGHYGRLFSVSGDIESVLPYVERTVGRNQAYLKFDMSCAVIFYLNRVTQDGATSEVLPLFR